MNMDLDTLPLVVHGIEVAHHKDAAGYVELRGEANGWPHPSNPREPMNAPALLGVALRSEPSTPGVSSWRGYAGGGRSITVVYMPKLKTAWAARMDVGRVRIVARAGTWTSLVELFKKRLLQHFTTLPMGFGERSLQPKLPEETRTEMQEKSKTVEAGERVFENLLSQLAENAAVTKWAAQNLLDRKRDEGRVKKNLVEAQEKVDACAATHAELMQHLKEVYVDTHSLFDTLEARSNNELGQAVGSIPANPPELGHTLTVRVCGVTSTLPSVPGGWSGLVAPGRTQLSIYPLVDGYLVVLSGQQRVVKAWADLMPEILDLIVRQGAHKRD